MEKQGERSRGYFEVEHPGRWFVFYGLNWSTDQSKNEESNERTKIVIAKST